MKRYYLIFFIFLFYGCAIKQKIEKKQIEFNSVKIKGGEFLMGSSNDKFGDKKLHTVFLNDFYIDKSEVTNLMYKRYLKRDFSIKKIDDRDNFPVVNVTYYEAKKYCKSLGKRLPSEAEWEFVASVEDKKEYDNSRNLSKNKIMKIKQFAPNSYGVFDMLGNVREWVEDSYEKYYYNNSPKKNPINRKKLKYRVTRGGSYKYSDGFPKTASFRSFDKPTDRFDDLGFRCAYDNNITD